MPIFECPKCGKQDVIPLAMCEWILDSVPYSRHDLNSNPIYTLTCADCTPLKVEVVEGELRVDPAEPDGPQSADLDADGERLDDGHSPSTERGAGSRF